MAIIKYRFVLFVALTAIGLAACSIEQPRPVLMLGTNQWAGYQPLYLARHIGALDDSPIKLVEYTSTTEVMRAYRDGLLNAAAVTLDEAISLQAGGVRSKIILVMDESYGADMLITKPHIKTLTDLKGKTVGAEQTALGAYFLSRIMDKAQIAAEQIHTSLLPANEHGPAFNKNQIDAVITFEPIAGQLIAAGGHKLFDSSMIPGEIIDVLIVKEDFLSKNTETIKQLLKGWFLSLERIGRHDPQAITFISDRLNIKEEEYLQVLKEIKFPDLDQNLTYFNSADHSLPDIAERMIDVMWQSNLLSHPVDSSTLTSGHLLNQM